MKDHGAGGIHEPGLRRAGEAGPTTAELRALTARVSALEFPPPPAAGGNTYVFHCFEGNSYGAGGTSFPGARVGDKVLFALNFIGSTPVLQEQDVSTWEAVITVNDQIQQTNTADLHTVVFLVVLQRGAPIPMTSGAASAADLNALTNQVAAQIAALTASLTAAATAAAALTARVAAIEATDPAGTQLNAFLGVILPGFAINQDLPDADSDIQSGMGRYTMRSGTQTADRTLTLLGPPSPGWVTQLPGLFVTIVHEGANPSFLLHVMNGGPAGGELLEFGSFGSTDWMAQFVFDGTNWLLEKYCRLN